MIIYRLMIFSLPDDVPSHAQFCEFIYNIYIMRRKLKLFALVGEPVSFRNDILFNLLIMEVMIMQLF